MGGKVALFLATNHPDLVQKLIIADIAPKTYNDRHSFIFKALQQIDFENVKSRKEIENQLSKTIENQGILQFLLKNVYHTDSGKLALRFNLSVLEKNYHLMNETLPSSSVYEGKTLFLKGQYSDYINSSDNLIIQKHFPNSEMVTISNAGHWLHAENPLDFYDQCFRFLKND
jgi:pimeloyl-ACP methyl ester carboxylesterase